MPPRENFFLQLYRACEQTDWDLLHSFWTAWKAIGRYRKRIRGSSIILWSAASLIEDNSSDLESPRLSEMRLAIQTPRVSTRIADPRFDSVAQLIRVKVKPKPQLNYSSIHNNQSLFDEFILWFDPGPHSEVEADSGTRSELSDSPIDRVNDIDVTVQLRVGMDVFPFQTRLSLGHDEVRFDLGNTDPMIQPGHASNPVGGVRLPLSPGSFRLLSERVQASLLVTVAWHDQIVYRHTHPVWLAPIDQWTLNDREIGWLPSFVQPRDPVVLDVIEHAQNYLECLADHREVSFNGYQSYDATFADRRRWDGIDLQVRAIWSALLQRHGLHYINPPPSLRRIHAAHSNTDGHHPIRIRHLRRPRRVTRVLLGVGGNTSGFVPHPPAMSFPGTGETSRPTDSSWMC